MGMDAIGEMKLTDRELAIIDGRDPDVDASANDAYQPADGIAPDTEVNVEGEGKEALSDPPDEPEPKAATEQDWRTDLQPLADSYGLTAEQLADFGSVDEFKRAARLFDAQATRLAAAGRPTEEVAEEPAATPKPPAAEKAKPITLDPEQYRKQGYDQDTINLVEHARQMQEQLQASNEKVERHEAAYREIEQRRAMDAFHTAVDGLDSDRFGRSRDDGGRFVALSKEHDAARRKIYDAAIEIQNLGLNVPENVLLQRAEMLVFGDDIRAKERGKVKKEVADQSKLRRSAGSRPVRPRVAAPVAGVGSETEQAREIANIPEVAEMWNRLETENGSK